MLRSRLMNQMILLAALASLVVAFPALARVGEVQTREGKYHEGQVRFTREGLVVINASLDSVTPVGLTNLARVIFQTNDAFYGLEAADESVETLPEIWQEADIGKVTLAGSTRHIGGVFTVRSSGLDIGGENDSFHYVYKAVTGNTEIVCRVVSVQYTDPLAKAGLMVRDGLAEYSRQVSVGLTAWRGGFFQTRERESTRANVTMYRENYAPQWIKLRREGSQFTGFQSKNGRQWTMVERVTVPMNEKVFVGLAVASAREFALNWTTIDKVREAPSLLNVDFLPQVELVSGSMLSGRIDSINDQEVNFYGSYRSVTVPTRAVSRIFFQWLPVEMADKVRGGRTGVLLGDGDFFDGEFKVVDKNKLTISSVLFGLRAFEMNNDLMAAVFRRGAPVRPVFEVRTTDGSIWLATSLALARDEVVLEESALGRVRIPSYELAEIRRR